ncbi:MAG: T9SS type A sorting domain-containing protein, partial [Bacteroidota bacterium]
NVQKGTTYRIAAPIGGVSNTYRWVFDGEVVRDATVDTTGSSYIIQDIGYENQGKFTLIVENSEVPGLTLTSSPQEVYATVDIDFIPIYTDIDGLPAPLDEGDANLLQVIAPGQPFDSTQQVTIDATGLRFPEVILGDYLISIRTDSLLLRSKDGRVDSVQLLPTYYRSTFLWEEADTLFLRGEIDGDSLIMQQRPRPLTPEDGNGVVGLTVESEFADVSGPGAKVLARRTVKRAGCSLRRRRRATGGRTENDEFELVAYKETDDDGRVTFNNLPDGTYRLNIEYPGIPMDTTSFLEFEVGAGGMEDNTLTLEATVAEEGIAVELVEALGVLRKYFKDLQIFPNPADRAINIAYKKLASENVRVQLLSISGQVLKEQDVTRGFNEQMALNVEDMEEGIYLLRFFDRTAQSENIMTYRVLIRR